MIRGMVWPWFGHSSLNHNEHAVSRMKMPPVPQYASSLVCLLDCTGASSRNLYWFVFSLKFNISSIHLGNNVISRGSHIIVLYRRPDCAYTQTWVLRVHACIRALVTIVYQRWADQSNLYAHQGLQRMVSNSQFIWYIISPGKLPFLERFPILARPFHF